MTIRLQITAEPLWTAFEQWFSLMRANGQSTSRLLRRLMRHYIGIAISEMKTGGLGGNPAKIETDLMQLTAAGKRDLLRRSQRGENSGYRRNRLKNALAGKYRGTVAAYLVRLLNWGNANTARGKRGQDLFYGKVGRFKAARKYSSRLHLAGWYPALQQLRGTQNLGGRVPRYRKLPPGDFSQQFTEIAANLIAENYASAAQRPGRPAPLGIVGLERGAMKRAESRLEPTLIDWLSRDLLAAAQKTGIFRIAA